eukprot:2113360-Pyramimonas_sp.AAC.1
MPASGTEIQQPGSGGMSPRHHWSLHGSMVCPGAMSPHHVTTPCHHTMSPHHATTSPLEPARGCQWYAGGRRAPWKHPLLHLAPHASSRWLRSVVISAAACPTGWPSPDWSRRVRWVYIIHADMQSCGGSETEGWCMAFARWGDAPRDEE